MTSEPGKQTIAIHILPNISKSKGNQTMKFDQFIEYNNITWKTFFLKNHTQKYSGETILRPFSKNSKSICLDQ